MRFSVTCYPVLVVVICLGCQSSTDRPVRTSFSAEPMARPAAASAVVPRPSRPVPVVIRPPVGLQVERLEQRLSQADSQRTIRPVAATLPLDKSKQAAPRRLLEPTQPASATWATDISTTLASYTAAFNRHDPVALATHWTTDGENLDLDTGNRTVGRDAVEQVFDRLFTADGTAQIDFDIEAVRPIRDDVAVVDGVSRLALAGQQPTRSRFSAVLVRHDGRWLIESVREATAPASPSVQDRLAPLAWLRGSWEDVSDGLTISMQCDWAAEGGFLIRRHLITDEPQPPGGAARTSAGIPALLPAPTPDGTDLSSVQRRTITEFIGWDQGRGEIRSWMFCSDGRTAEFSWLRSGAGWLLTHAHDPAAATAEPGQLMLERVGADELTLQLRSGIVDDLLPPADFVRTARPIDGDEND